MFTMAGYFENQNSAVLIATLALADAHIGAVLDNIPVPAEMPNLAGVYVYGADVTQGQLNSPSLREKAMLDIQPVDDSADEPTSNPPFHDYFDRPIPLVPTELLSFLGAEDNAGAGDMAAFIWLMNEITPLPPGDIFTVRCTNTTTLVADTWTNGVLTFTQDLAAGRYAVAGMRAQSAGLRAARLAPVGGGWRPGCIGFDAALDIEPPRFRHGRAGSWMEFEHNRPPSADFMSLSGDTAQVVHLDLVQIRKGPP